MNRDRKQRRRDERTARKQQAGTQRQWTLPQVAAELAGDDVGDAATWLDPNDPDTRRFAETGMRSTTGKWPLLQPIVIKLLRRCIQDAGVCEPYDQLLRSHPGVPSTLTTEALLLSGLMSAWANNSFWVTDITTHLAGLPPELAVELGAVTRDGTPGMKYQMAYRQLWRLLDVLHAEAQKGGAGYDTDWLERRLIPPSIPPDFLEMVESGAVDETSSPIWHVEQCKVSQKRLNKQVKKIFRKRHPGCAVPDMSSPLMREIAAELGVPLGADGRIERTPLNRAARKGYRTPTSTQPDPWYTGFGVFCVHATRSFTLARNRDDATLGPPVQSYILAVTTRPANTNAGPVGYELMVRTASLCPNLHHVHADQGFTRKIMTFVVLLRRMGIQVHMGIPRDGSDKPRPIAFKRRDGTSIMVKEYRGALYHRFTPNSVFKLPYERRRDWMYVPHSHGADGSIRFQCPFAKGTIANRNLTNFKGNPSARLVKIPKGLTSCCDNICSIVASPEQLARYQVPHHGSNAHTKISGLRNPVEGGYGTAKSQGGYDPKKNRLPEQEPPALRSLFQAVVRNLQTTLNGEFVAIRAHLKAQKDAKRTRRSEQAARKRRQNPKDLPHITEPGGRDGLADEDDPAENDPADDDPSSAALTPPRAPP